MRVGELSRRSGVGVSMIKFYLREGMLPAGDRGGAPNQVDYGEAHLRRLRLLRALTDQGGLSVGAIRRVLAAVDGPAPLPEVLAVTQDAVVVGPDLDDTDEPAARLVADLVSRRGWHVDPGNPGYRAAARLLTTAERLGFDALVDLLDAYADAAEDIATREVDAYVTEVDRERDLEAAVSGVVLGERLLAALRTMAHQHATLRRFADADHAWGTG